MRIIDRHIEYLIRRHDCVVVPGIGALLCRYKPASFTEDGKRILPPGRELAFNRWLTDSDGLLVASVSRELGISNEKAFSIVQDEVDGILAQLDSCRKMSLGQLGTLNLDEKGDLSFDAALNVAGVNGFFYGLLPISPELVSQGNEIRPEVVLSSAATDSETGSQNLSRRDGLFPYQWRAYASGIVATLAVLLTLAFFVLSPITIDKNAQTASIAPVSVSYVKHSDDKAPVASTATGEPDLPLSFKDVMGIALALPDSVSYVTETYVAVSVESAKPEVEEAAQNVPSIRFNEADSYFVIVASFPTLDQAKSYIRSHAGRKLGILEMDGRCRVYAATGADYAMVSSMKSIVNEADAWICHR